MIMNPSNGPGAAVDPDFVATIEEARSRGVAVLGYVYTEYGFRSLSAVRADVAKYYSWYDVSGIFFDEAASSASSLSYYRTLEEDVRAHPGAIVMLNPGLYPSEGYMTVGDIVVVFEGDYSSYVQLEIPSWVVAYPPSKYSHLVYGTSAGNLSSALSLAHQRHAGYVYVTSDVLPNPWDTLPSYWSTEAETMAGLCY